jgi:hypothetical protein
LKVLDFPPKRLAVESSSLVPERLPMLQRFLRSICSATTRNEYHPSTIKIQLTLQHFLAVEEKLHIMTIQDTDWQLSTLARYVQVYLHTVMHMAVMDKVVHGFVDSFMAHQIEDVSQTWTTADCDSVCLELRNFLEHVQHFLFDCFFEDCMDLINRHPALQHIFAGKSATWLKKLQQSDERPSLLEKSSELSTKGVSLTDLCEMTVLVSEDELSGLVRTAIRRQVEIDIYLGCMGRVAYILHESLGFVSERFDSKVIRLCSKSQSFFGIPPHHSSPSDWGAAVVQFRAIAGNTLPSDKIDSLLAVARCLFKLFQLEHPNSDRPLSADDMLPIFIFIVVQARVPNLVVIDHEMQELCDSDQQMSESGYYLATLHATITHILDANIDRTKFLITD